MKNDFSGSQKKALLFQRGGMEKGFFSLFSAIFFMGVSGCISYQPSDLSPRVSAQNFAQRSLNNTQLTQYLSTQGVPHAGRGGWSVDELALVAVYWNGEMGVARSEVAEAHAATSKAAEMPNPVLSFSPGYNMTSRGISPWVVSPVLDVTIETAGKRALRVRQARAAVEASQLRVAAMAWSLRNQVRSAMLECYRAQESRMLLERVKSKHELAVSLLKSQVDAGEASAFELTLARQVLSQSNLALHDIKKRDDIAHVELATAIGVPTHVVNALKLDFSSFHSLPRPASAKLRRSALVHRADLLAMLADYAAADMDLRLEIAKQYPDIHLSPGYEFDQGDHKWLLGFGVELPVMNQNRGAIHQAMARRVKLGKIFEAKQAAVLGEIEKARVSYQSSLAKVQTATLQAKAAARAVSMSKSMLDVGEITRVDLTRLEIESAMAERAKNEARMEALADAGALESAIQVPMNK